MTSTSMNQGLNEGSKPSSKVLKPPGGGSSDIFGTGAPVVASPARARAPPSNNIFGGYEEPSGGAAPASKHNHMRSNVFSAGGEPEPSPGSARKSSKTYESRVFPGQEGADPNQNKSDEEKEKEKEENGEGEETENNNDTKAAPAVKAKGDSVYNPITGELNIGQAESPTKDTKLNLGKARGQYNRDRETFNIGAQEEHVPHSARMSHNQRAYSGNQQDKVFSSEPDPEAQKTSTRRINADVSNPITGETKSFAIGGAGENVNRPSTRVHHPPGGASTPLW